AQAFVVVFTPDDAASLLPAFRSGTDSHDAEVAGQPRQNVLFEAGMAMALSQKRTIIVTFGKLRPISDIAGLHFLRMGDAEDRRNELATRLETAGCAVDKHGNDWLTAGDFTKVIATVDKALAGMTPSIEEAPARPLLEEAAVKAPSQSFAAPV